MVQNRLTGKAGRKSAAARAAKNELLASLGLPAAPAYLPRMAKEQWDEIVRSYPADRFPRGTWPMLEGYCIQAAVVRDLTRRLSETDASDIHAYNRLLTMLDRALKGVASFGVRLGIARTSASGRHNYDPDDTRDSAEDPAPWEKRQ